MKLEQVNLQNLFLYIYCSNIHISDQFLACSSAIATSQSPFACKWRLRLRDSLFHELHSGFVPDPRIVAAQHLNTSRYEADGNLCVHSGLEVATCRSQSSPVHHRGKGGVRARDTPAMVSVRKRRTCLLRLGKFPHPLIALCFLPLRSSHTAPFFNFCATTAPREGKRKQESVPLFLQIINLPRSLRALS